MRAEVDRGLCVGAANCVAIAPTVFALDEQRIAVVLDPDSVDKETLVQAAESCPTAAIAVWDDEGIRIYP